MSGELQLSGSIFVVNRLLGYYPDTGCMAVEGLRKHRLFRSLPSSIVNPVPVYILIYKTELAPLINNHVNNMVWKIGINPLGKVT